jgi:AcrR family transcriptional regulator
MARARREDRRVRKTRALLRESLASLVHEKDYDAISVTEILERANVGRSTFYTHFAGKDDLLVSGMHDMLRSVSTKPLPPSAKPHERRIGFSLPILEHVVEQRSAAGGGNESPRPGGPARAPAARTHRADRRRRDARASAPRQGAGRPLARRACALRGLDLRPCAELVAREPERNVAQGSRRHFPSARPAHAGAGRARIGAWRRVERTSHLRTHLVKRFPDTLERLAAI